jgi:hypothetical protein
LIANYFICLSVLLSFLESLTLLVCNAFYSTLIISFEISHCWIHNLQCMKVITMPKTGWYGYWRAFCQKLGACVTFYYGWKASISPGIHDIDTEVEKLKKSLTLEQNYYDWILMHCWNSSSQLWMLLLGRTYEITILLP